MTEKKLRNINIDQKTLDEAREMVKRLKEERGMDYSISKYVRFALRKLNKEMEKLLK